MPARATGRSGGREASDRPVPQLEAAIDAGYELGYVNGNGQRIITGCIAHPTAGAMGYHYFNKALIDDLVVDVAKPEGLVYAPRADGSLKLVAVEYVVPGPNSNPPGVRARRRAGDGHAHPRPGRGLLHHACLGLGSQPGGDVHGLESRGQLLLGAAPRSSSQRFDVHGRAAGRTARPAARGAGGDATVRIRTGPRSFRGPIEVLRTWSLDRFFGADFASFVGDSRITAASREMLEEFDAQLALQLNATPGRRR